LLSPVLGANISGIMDCTKLLILQAGETPKPVAPPAAPSGPGRLRRLLRRLRRLALWGIVVAAGATVGFLLILALWLNLTPDRGVDVLLLTFDTQRIDGMGCYGGAPNTPNMDRLAAGGVLFENTVVSIPRTTQNISTLLTSLEPKDHGVRELFDRLPDDIVTLAEAFRDAGYKTSAFVGGGPLGEEQNIYQGFDEVHVHAFEDQSRAMAEAASAASWITRHASGPWFTWVHVYDPHFYYAPPWPFWDRSAPEMPEIRAMYSRLARGHGSFGALHYQNDLDERKRKTLVDLYHGETRAVDFVFGWLIRMVKFYEWLDPGRDTLIVVTADHGEGLGEHGCYYNHGAYLYDEDLLVPLVMHLPGDLPAGMRIPQQARTIDIYPTILELVGLDLPGRLAGRSLLPYVDGEETEERLAFSEGDTNRHPQNPRFYFEDGLAGRWRSVRDGGYKLIRIPHPEGDRFELYDLEADPGETRNLAEADLETLERLKEILAAWETRPSLLDLEEQVVDPDELEEQLERLRSLGYVN
jgi:arylsulfatase A-like enzyme